MGLFLLYSHIRSLFKKKRTHQVELVSWWWLFGEARTTHQTIYQSWGGGIIRLWNVVKVTFWKQSFNTTAFSGIYLLLMSECSSMAQGGEKGESIEDLVCFFFNKISTSISFGSIIGSFFRSLVICFCSYFNYPASQLPRQFWLNHKLRGFRKWRRGMICRGWVLFLKIFLFPLFWFSCVYNTPLFLSAVQKSVWKCQNMQKRVRKSGF